MGELPSPTSTLSMSASTNRKFGKAATSPTNSPLFPPEAAVAFRVEAHVLSFAVAGTVAVGRVEFSNALAKALQ